MATYLSFTPSTLVAAERRKFTYSCWFKFGNTPGSAEQHFIYAAGSSNTYVRIQTDGTIRFRLFDAPQDFLLATTAVYRDPSSWYHLVLQLNTPDSSSTERVKIYINGEQQTLSGSYPTQDYSGWINNTSAQNIPASGDGSCYMAEIHMCANQIYAPTTFGQTDSTTGEWKPKNVSGVSYGTNGYYLKFANSGAMGTDSSGNGNTWTVNSAGTNPQTVDTPSNNFVTMNSIANKFPNSTFTLGNLAVAMGASQSTFNAGTFGVSSGKWYFEMKPTALGSGTDNCLVGIVSRSDSTGTSDYLGEPTSIVYRNNGQRKTDSGNATYGASWTTSDIVMVAVDCDNNNIYFGTNGQWADGSGNNDEASPNSAIAFTSTMISDGVVFPAFGDLSTNSPEPAGQFNFGNPPFTISSGNADANGYGNFEYAVPSGYYSLCTKNLNTYG